MTKSSSSALLELVSKQKGAIDLLILLAVTIIAAAIPAATKLVQERQEMRKLASLDVPCKVCKQETGECVQTTWPPMCSHSFNECTSRSQCPQPTKPPATPTVNPPTGGPTGGPTKPPQPTNTPKPTSTPIPTSTPVDHQCFTPDDCEASNRCNLDCRGWPRKCYWTPCPTSTPRPTNTPRPEDDQPLAETATPKPTSTPTPAAIDVLPDCWCDQETGFWQGDLCDSWQRNTNCFEFEKISEEKERQYEEMRKFNLSHLPSGSKFEEMGLNIWAYDQYSYSSDYIILNPMADYIAVNPVILQLVEWKDPLILELNLRNIERALNSINPDVYQNTILALSNTSLGLAGRLGEVVTYTEEGYRMLNYPAVAIGTLQGVRNHIIQDIDEYFWLEKYIGEDLNREEILLLGTVEKAQRASVRHEYFHLFQDQNPVALEAMNNLYWDNLEALEIAGLRPHIKDSEEPGPILAIEQVYNFPAFYQVAFPEIYQTVYDIGFFQEGVLPKPGTYQDYAGYNHRQLFELYGTN